MKFEWARWWSHRLVEYILQIGWLVRIGLDGKHFTDWWKTFADCLKIFADCFMRVLACEEDEDEDGPSIATRWLVFRRSKGINRI